MKTVRVIRFTIGILLLLFVLVLPAQADAPQEANGLWQYQPFILDEEQVGCKTILTTFENGLWTGTFEGSSTEDGHVIIGCNGKWSFKAIVTFDQVTVDGKSGTLKMMAVGSRPDGDADWFGRWLITSATGELSGLRGQGTWWGPGAPAPEEWGDIYYDGQVHFVHH